MCDQNLKYNLFGHTQFTKGTVETNLIMYIFDMIIFLKKILT